MPSIDNTVLELQPSMVKYGNIPKRISTNGKMVRHCILHAQ